MDSEGKPADAWSWPFTPIRAKVKDERIFTFTPPYGYMACENKCIVSNKMQG